MIFRYFVASLLVLATSTAVQAQTDKEDKQEQQQERKAANQDKVDVNLFRRQILASQEYSAERRKVPALQKAGKGTVKIVAFVDSTDIDDAAKLTGFIQRVSGDNTINVYELTFSRISRKITNIKLTGETDDTETDEADVKKPASKQMAKTKKKKDDDEDEDEPEDKPASKKQKKQKDEDD